MLSANKHNFRLSVPQRTLVVGITIVIALATLGGTWSCQLSASPSVKSITVAWSPFEQQALLWIAEEQEIFSQNGLNINFHKYDTGAASLDGMLNGEADLTVGVTEFPVVKKIFDNSKARVVGTIARIEQQYIVARKDREIEKISDLKGKKIGTTFGTIAEFYLSRFLLLNGIDIQEVTVFDLKTPAEWENAVADGMVDAVLTAQPYVDLAIKRLGNNAIVWPAQGGQYVFGLVVSSNDWLTKNPETIKTFLKSLAQAEEYAALHPVEAKAIVQKRLNVELSFVESIWLRDQFSLSLDEAFVVAMEDEARWMIKNNLTTGKEVPLFNNFIYFDGLLAVKPEAVNIIR